MIAAAALSAIVLLDLAASQTLYQQRKFIAAEKSLRQAIARNPADAMARLWLARTLIELKRTPEAIAQIERALDRNANPDVRFEAGRIFRELAERRLSDLQTATPGSAATLELAGEQLERQGNLDEALVRYRGAATLEPRRPGIHYRIGNVLWRKRELPAALEAVQKELAISPHHGMANLRLGEILLQSEKAEEALAPLERAVAAMPDSVPALREIGKALRKAGKPEAARPYWETAARLRADDDQIHYLLGGLYRELGLSEESRRELEAHRKILERRRKPAPQP